MIVVTIPAHNEEKTVGDVVRAVRRACRDMLDVTVIVACNNCADSTQREAANAGAVTFEVPEPGLANVFRAEMREAIAYKPYAVVHIDADGQYAASDIPRLLLELADCDMVMGNRLWKRPDGMPVSKFVLNRLGSAGYSAVCRGWIPDITTGLRAFTPDVALIGTRLKSRYTYTQELTWLAMQNRMRISSIPVQFHPRADGKSRLMHGSWHYLSRSLSDFWRFAR